MAIGGISSTTFTRGIVAVRGGSLADAEAGTDANKAASATGGTETKGASARSSPTAGTGGATAAGGSGTKQLTTEEQQQVEKLKLRDAEVRAHEQAHMNAGGPHAGSPQYEYQKGPDDQNYAIGGEVAIDASPIPDSPDATIAKMEIVRRAALAPARPSAQDLKVAAEAAQTAAQARQEKQAKSRAGTGAADSSGTGRADRTTGVLGAAIAAQAGASGLDGVAAAGQAAASYRASVSLLANRSPALFAISV